MNNKIVVDDGTKEVEIANKYGKVFCRVHFRPADFALLDRLNNLRQEAAEIIKPLQSIGVKPDGTADTEEEWRIINDVESKVKEKFAQVFDMDDADAIFEKRHAFSIIGGEFFITLLIEQISQYIAKAIEAEAKESRKRINKYLSPEAQNAGKSTD